VAVKGQMPGAVGRAPELEMAPALQDAIQDRLGEIASWRTRPQAASGLFVVKIMGR
jgi:hypothetical protein